MEKEDISSVVSIFHDFFTDDYKEKVNELKLAYPDQKSLYVDYRKLESKYIEIADLLLKKPEMVVEAAEEALEGLKPYIPGGVKFEPNVRFVNLPADTFLIEHLGSTNINEMVAFKGVVTRRADVMHKVRIAVYQCAMCNSEVKYFVDRGFIPPKKCDECKKIGTMRQVEEKSDFVDIQRAEVQELLERVRGGAPAAHVELLLEDDIVNTIVPGDNIEISGTMRLKAPMKMRQKQELVYSRYIQVNSAQSLKRDFEEIEITKEDEARIKELAKDPNIIEYVVKSIAPSIYGHDEVKRALALQLFGGTKGKIMKGGASIRDDIHILLIGDPGIAKTRFLLSVNEIAPKSVYVSGKSVSGAGLTVSAEKDELGEGGWTLKAGAIVLASGGSVQIDEFDKIAEDDRSALHEAMETQSYHYSTKLMFSDGQEIPIGELVESYMAENKEKIIRGRNCLILREGIKNIKLLTTDFENIRETTPAQISKHIAPDHYIKVVLQTGRELLVTPEHPFWIVENGEIKTKEAEELTEKDYTLMPLRLPLRISQPKLEPEFFKFMGYHITDGGYELNRGIKNGINFYNKDSDLIEDYHDAVKNVFDVHIYSRKNPSNGVIAERISSMPLLRHLEEIHPPLIGNGREKHIPPDLLCAPEEFIAPMLRAAFDGDGTFTGHSIALVGENKVFIGQVQLLLLRFGIRSRIFKDGNVFRLSITGKENLKQYQSSIGFLSKKKRAKLATYLQKDSIYRNTTDIIPGCSAKILELLKKLKIHENETFGYGLHSQKKGCCFTRRNFSSLCMKMREKTNMLEDVLRNIASSSFEELLNMRTKLKISQEDMASACRVSRATVSYWERKMIFGEKYSAGLETAIRKMLSCENELVKLERLAFGDIGFVAVKKVERVQNKGDKWVYDVTVEPSRAFISECTVLHNTISVAKAGIVAKFKSKTSVLAAANPKYGRFDQNKNLADQFDVPPTLLSRFDLIFPIVDILDEEKDSKLAEHILTTHRGEEVLGEGPEVVGRELLRKYVSYARRKVFPKLSKEASEKIREFYVELRGKSRDAGSVAITPRYLEGLVRLAEANAKIRLNDVVEEEDAEAAINLFNYVMKQIMIDRETGLFDVDVVTTGKPKSKRDRLQKVDTVREIVKEHLKHADSADIDEVVKDAASYEIDDDEARRIISELLRRGELYENEPGHIKIVR